LMVLAVARCRFSRARFSVVLAARQGNKATIRRAVARLEILGLNPVDVGVKVVSLNIESPVGRALQTFHRRTREI